MPRRPTGHAVVERAVGVLRRYGLQALGTVAVLGVVVGVAVVAAPRTDEVGPRTPTPSATPSEVSDVAEDADAETPASDEAVPPEGGQDATGSATTAGGSVEVGPALTFTPRTPETQASVYAAIVAHRTARNLPTYNDNPYPNGECVWGPGGSVWPWDIPASESLAAAMIRRLPATVNYAAPAGAVAVLLVNADSFIDSASGTVYPGQVGTIFVKHCFPPAPPPPPPPPPSPPPPPPADPTDPPAEPDPEPTP